MVLRHTGSDFRHSISLCSIPPCTPASKSAAAIMLIMIEGYFRLRHSTNSTGESTGYLFAAHPAPPDLKVLPNDVGARSEVLNQHRQKGCAKCTAILGNTSYLFKLHHHQGWKDLHNGPRQKKESFFSHLTIQYIQLPTHLCFNGSNGNGERVATHSRFQLTNSIRTVGFQHY